MALMTSFLVTVLIIAVSVGIICVAKYLDEHCPKIMDCMLLSMMCSGAFCTIWVLVHLVSQVNI